jgi:aryl-alcohol dehydrogenase-like predicted oxidoreductase
VALKTVELGNTGLRIFPLVLGTLPMGPLQAGFSPEAGGRIIRAALEAGVTMLDTAELYGTYGHVRAGIAGWTGPLAIVSKTHAADPAGARAHVERALREMGRERLEVVHMHGARVERPFVDRADVFAELLKMKDEGKIAHVGMSSHFVPAVREAAAHPEVEVLHPLINRTGMGILGGTRDEMADAVEACAAAGKGIYAMKALAGGNLIPSARESIGWVRSKTFVHAVAIGMLSVEEVEANVRLFDDGTAEEGAWAPLEARRRKLRIMRQFCKGCGACVPACASAALSVRDGKAEVDEAACILCGYCAEACPEFIIRVV